MTDQIITPIQELPVQSEQTTGDKPVAVVEITVETSAPKTEIVIVDEASVTEKSAPKTEAIATVDVTEPEASEPQTKLVATNEAAEPKVASVATNETSETETSAPKSAPKSEVVVTTEVTESETSEAKSEPVIVSETAKAKQSAPSTKPIALPEAPVLFERQGGVVIVRLNRPRVLNALNTEIMHQIVNHLQDLDNDPEIGCFVITGTDKVFSAGADIKELASKSYADMALTDHFAGWDRFAALRTPKIAAVAGYALGGGCELAMMCDTIYAAESAKFGQPEINLGVIPGMGGSQRLTRLVGKAKAMDMILTGRMLSATEAEQAGLVARILPNSDLMSETLTIAQQIAGYGKLATVAARAAVNHALDVGLHEGITFERQTYYALWATEDKKEGMSAFLQKRSPVFKNW